AGARSQAGGLGGGRLVQRLGGDRDVGGGPLGLGLPPGIRSACEHATPVEIADIPADVAVVLESLHETREGALREMDLLGELLDPAVSLGGLGEATQHLVLGE